METYVFKFSACLAIFWLVYILFLERQTMHRFKRFYLLIAIASALVIPILTITQYVEPVPSDFEVSTMYITNQPTLIEQPKEQPPFFNLETVLWILYGLGVFVFVIRFIVNLYKMYKRISAHQQIKKRPFIYVLLDECRIPHSFFNYLFFEQSKYKTNAIPNEVKLHEETHAKQLHSLDIISIELLQIVFWFHPLIYILKHHIKLNHEFLADQAVLNEGIDTKVYQKTLLQFSSNAHEYQLSSTINYSSIKKRFTVMKTQTSKTRMWLSSLLLLPIIAILFYSFAEKEYIEKEPTEIPQFLELENTLNSEKLTQQKPPTEQEKATAKQVAAYNHWAKSINEQMAKAKASNGVNTYPIVKVKEVKKYKAIYDIMTIEQRKDSEVWPSFPPPPPPPPAPKSKDKSDDSQNKNTIQPVEITILKDKSLVLNGEPIKFEELNAAVNKLNAHLTIKEKRNYVTASIKLETNDSKDFAKKIGQELTKVDIFSNCISFNVDDEKKKKIASSHFSPNAGLTIEEAKAQKEKDLKAYEESLESQNNKTKSPWAINMGVTSVEAVDNTIHKQGPIEINGATYYFTQQNGKTTYYDSYGKVVDINNVPPPPPIPNKATPEQKAKMKKATDAYMKANPDKVGKVVGENGETLDVIEVPKDLQGTIDINGETFYYTTSHGKTTYYNNSGKEVKMDNLPPPPPTKNPSFLEFIIEMEQEGAIFYMDGKKITANEAKGIVKTDKGKKIEMLTQKDENGTYIVKLSKQIKN
jgi:beta-lactamase regulating signal transducer with metallopeptidase domain